MTEQPETEAYQPQYPPLQSLGQGLKGTTSLCYDPYREGSQVVQKLFNQQTSRQVPDLVEHGFAKLQGVAHPYLALVRDFGWEGSQTFLVREWIQGSNFSQILPKLRPEEILGIIRQLLEALGYLLTQNILHLHLKPENLIIVTDSASGHVLKLTDFGLNEILYRPLPQKELAAGTLPYTAPEYFISPRPDPRADLYSVGILAYWTLSKRLPYAGKDTQTILAAQKKAEPKPLEKVADVGHKLSDWVQSLIQPSPQDRPQDLASAYQAFLGALSGIKLKSSSVPPLVFSNTEQIFRRKYALKTFRRIAGQGRRWAFQGPRGVGKTFFARWMQRLFWVNEKRVVFYDGQGLVQLFGESLAHPGDLLFVIIDNADKGPVPAWLEARPYQHVIVFGEDLTWAKTDPQWQFHSLENLEAGTLQEIYTGMFEKMPETNLAQWTKSHQGNPGGLVREVRAWARQGLIQPFQGKWRFRETSLLGVLKEGGENTLGQALAGLEPQGRRAVTLLSMVQAPLTPETLAEWLDRDADSLQEILWEGVRQELLIRRLWWGREFFQSTLPPPLGLPAGVGDPQVQEWSLGLEELGWYRQSKEILERSCPAEKLQRDGELILTRCRLAGLIGHDPIVFQNITPTFLRGLSPEQVGPAFEILGRSLMATGRGDEAESAYKKAFAQYRSVKDPAGQVQVLMDLGTYDANRGESSRALKFFDHALGIAEKLPEASPLRGQVDLEIGRFYREATDYAKAEENLLKSIEHFTHYRQYHWLAKAYQNFASLWADQGEWDQAEFYGREALSIAAFKEDWLSLGRVFQLLSRVEEARGNPSGILERLSEAVFALEKQPQDPLLGESYRRRAEFYERNRQLEKARRDSDRLLELGNSRHNFSWIAQAHMIRGKVARRDATRLDQAYREFQRALENFSKIPGTPDQWECWYELGEVERNRGKPREARSHYESALSHLDRYVSTLSPGAREYFLKDGKRDQIELVLKWLRT